MGTEDMLRNCVIVMFLIFLSCSRDTEHSYIEGNVKSNGRKEKRVIEISAMDILNSAEFKSFRFQEYATKIRERHAHVPLRGDRLLIDFGQRDDIDISRFYKVIDFFSCILGREEPGYLRFRVKGTEYIQPFIPMGRNHVYNLRGDRLKVDRLGLYSFVKVVIIPFSSQIRRYKLFGREYDNYDDFFEYLKKRYKDKPGIVIDITMESPQDQLSGIKLKHILPIYRSARRCGIDCVMGGGRLWKLISKDKILKPTITYAEDGDITKYKILQKGDFKGHPWIENPRITTGDLLRK